MKSFLRLLIFLCLLCGLDAFAAGNIITATVTLTNTVFGTSNYMTLAVNGDTRTWTNLVQVPAQQVLTNTTANGSTTNLFSQVSTYPFSSVSLTYASSNAINLKGTPGLAMNVTVSAAWATVALTTNYLTNAYILRLPVSVEQPAQQTNLASMAATMLEGSTNSLSPTDVLLSNYVSRSQAQGISGNKAFTGSSNFLAGGYAPSLVTTSAVNYGNAFNSPGAGNASLQIGSTASAVGVGSTAIGTAASGAGDYSAALGYSAGGIGQFSAALGANAQANDTNSTAIGYNAIVNLGFTNSTAVGAKASADAPNQVMLGSSGGGGVPAISVKVNNALTVGASATISGGATIANGTTNQWMNGTNTYLAGSDVAFTRYALATLANGANAAIPVGTNVFVEVSGPSGAFSIAGINGGPNRDGKFLIILNQTGQAMTISHDSGTDPTPANRIISMTGADQVTTGNGAATLIYSAAASRWIMISFAP